MLKLKGLTPMEVRLSRFANLAAQEAIAELIRTLCENDLLERRQNRRRFFIMLETTWNQKTRCFESDKNLLNIVLLYVYEAIFHSFFLEYSQIETQDKNEAKISFGIDGISWKDIIIHDYKHRPFIKTMSGHSPMVAYDQQNWLPDFLLPQEKDGFISLEEIQKVQNRVALILKGAIRYDIGDILDIGVKQEQIEPKGKMDCNREIHLLTLEHPTKLASAMYSLSIWVEELCRAYYWDIQTEEKGFLGYEHITPFCFQAASKPFARFYYQNEQAYTLNHRFETLLYSTLTPATGVVSLYDNYLQNMAEKLYLDIQELLDDDALENGQLTIACVGSTTQEDLLDLAQILVYELQADSSVKACGLTLTVTSYQSEQEACPWDIIPFRAFKDIILEKSNGASDHMIIRCNSIQAKVEFHRLSENQCAEAVIEQLKQGEEKYILVLLDAACLYNNQDNIPSESRSETNFWKDYYDSLNEKLENAPFVGTRELRTICANLQNLLSIAGAQYSKRFQEIEPQKISKILANQDPGKLLRLCLLISSGNTLESLVGIQKNTSKEKTYRIIEIRKEMIAYDQYTTLVRIIPAGQNGHGHLENMMPQQPMGFFFRIQQLLKMFDASLNTFQDEVLRVEIDDEWYYDRLLRNIYCTVSFDCNRCNVTLTSFNEEIPSKEGGEIRQYFESLCKSLLYYLCESCFTQDYLRKGLVNLFLARSSTVEEILVARSSLKIVFEKGKVEWGSSETQELLLARETRIRGFRERYADYLLICALDIPQFRVGDVLYAKYLLEITEDLRGEDTIQSIRESARRLRELPEQHTQIQDVVSRVLINSYNV